MDIDPPLRLFLIFLFFWGLVFFALSEASLFSLGRLRLQKLKEAGHPGHRVIERLLSHPRRLIISLLIGNEAFNVAISSLTSALFISFWGDWAKWLAIPAVVLGILLLGEALPKTIGVRNPETIAPRVAYLVDRIVYILGPLHWVIRKIVDGIFWLLGVKPDPISSFLTEQDFKNFLETSLKEGNLESSEKDLIHRVFRFSDQSVRNVMTPQSAVFALPISTRLPEAIAALRENQFSRVPVYRGENMEEIVGVLYAKDLLRTRRQKWAQDRGLRPFLRKAYFVPVSKKLDVLFKELQKQRVHMAVVVDEYGKMAGVVSLEDLLEELFGEIYDELDWQRKNGRSAKRAGRPFIPGIGSGS